MNLQVVTTAPLRAALSPRPPRAQPSPALVAQVLPLALGDLVPVERLTSTAQRFACVPLSARLSAAACLERQRLAVSTERGAQGLATWAPKRSDAYQICRGCALGAKVRARLEAPPALGRVAS